MLVLAKADGHLHHRQLWKVRYWGNGPQVALAAAEGLKSRSPCPSGVKAAPAAITVFMLGKLSRSSWHWPPGPGQPGQTPIPPGHLSP